MADIKDWNTTGSSNTDAAPNGYPTGTMLVNQLDNTGREVMAVLARWYEDTSAVNSLAGGTTAYTLSPSRTQGAYAAGDTYVAVCNATCVANPTLNINTQGAKNIVTQDQTQLQAGQLQANGIYIFSYDATNDTFICLNPHITQTTLGIIPAKRTVWVPAGAMIVPSTGGAAAATTRELATHDVNISYIEFADGSDLEAQFWLPFPKGWNEGTVTYKVFWTSTSGSSGNVVWELSAVSFANDDAMDAAAGTAVSVTSAWTADNDLHISSESSAVTISGAGESELQLFRLIRNGDDAGDTLTAVAQLLGVQIFYTRDAHEDT